MVTTWFHFVFKAVDARCMCGNTLCFCFMIFPIETHTVWACTRGFCAGVIMWRSHIITSSRPHTIVCTMDLLYHHTHCVHVCAVMSRSEKGVDHRVYASEWPSSPEVVNCPWQCLYRLPDPQSHKWLRDKGAACDGCAVSSVWLVVYDGSMVSSWDVWCFGNSGVCVSMSISATESISSSWSKTGISFVSRPKNSPRNVECHVCTIRL